MKLSRLLSIIIIYSTFLFLYNEHAVSSEIGHSEFETVRYRFRGNGDEPYFPFQAKGLSEIEATHRWTEGPLLIFTIPPLFENKRPSHLILKNLGALVSPHQGQIVQVIVDHYLFKRFNFTSQTPQQTIEIPLPNKSGLPTTVHFSLPYARLPGTVDPTNKDHRKLALLLRDAEVIYEKPKHIRLQMGTDQLQPLNLRNGFSVAEQTHRWLLGKQAMLTVPCKYDGQQVSQISFETFGFVSFDSDKVTQKLIVYGKGIKKREYNFNQHTPSHKVIIDLPYSGADHVDIRLEMPNACLPKTLDPQNGDFREISIGFKTADLAYLSSHIAWVQKVQIGNHLMHVANHVAIIGADRLHKIAQGQGSKVIVIDDGVDTNHQALAHNLTQTTKSSTLPVNSHGTHVSGIIQSIAPQVQLEFISKSNFSGSLWKAAQITGDVVNISLSFGCIHDSNVIIHDYYLTALEAIVKSDKVIMISFANDFNDDEKLKGYGKLYSKSLIDLVNNKRLMGRVRLVSNLSYTTPNDERMSDTSNRAIIPCSYAISAPGTHILSTLPGNQFGVYSGTSMSAPVVAGAYALLKSAIPGLAPEQYLSLLDHSARQYSRSGVKLDKSYGNGIVDVYAAYQLYHNSRL